MVDQSTRENTTIHTTIKPELIHFTLKRGGLIAASGAILMILGGTFIPVTVLKIWGIPLFIVTLTLIAVGWLPYSKLQRLIFNPHLLQDDGNALLFSLQGKPLLRIPKTEIARIAYVEKAHLYGIAIWFKKPVKEKIGVLQPRFNFKAFTNDSANRFNGCDLFLPFFTRQGFILIRL